tara:strand:- start:1200 stop:1790 length:591 start_codon:yes stop_codon:yes gene_type:complete
MRNHKETNVVKSEWSRFFRRAAIGLCSLTILYALFTWDNYVSKYLFEQLCNDKEQIGLFVYEKVPLSNEYLMPFPEGEEVRNLDPFFILSDNLMINRDLFDQTYLFETYKYVQYSKIGPIGLSVTSVTRMADRKLLGKAVSAKNSMGWFNRFASLGAISGNECPSGRDKNHFPNYERSHFELIKSIFSSKVKNIRR